MCQDHLARQELGFDDEHFAISAAQKKDLADGAQLATPDKRKEVKTEKGGDEDVLTPEKVAGVKIGREGPQLHRSMEASMRKIRSEFQKQLQLAVGAMKGYADHPAELKANDRALLAFCRTLQFRHELGVRVAERVGDIQLIVPDSSMCSGASVNSQPDPASVQEPANADAGSVIVQEPPSSLLETRKSISLEDFAREARTIKNKCWETDSPLQPLDYVHELMDSLLDVKDPEKFLMLKHDWQKLEKMYQGIAKSIKQAAEDVTKHMKLKVSEQAREKKRKADQEARDSLNKVKEEAKKQQDAIKKRKLALDAEETKLYSVDVQPTVVPLVKVVGQLEAADDQWKFPWLTDGGEQLELQFAEAALQKALTSWGSQYKRLLSQARPKVSIVTYPLEEKQGRKHVNEYLATFMKKAVDISEVTGGQTFMDQVWLYGVAGSHRSMSFLPNFASQTRVQLMGENRLLMFEWATLVAAMVEEAKADNKEPKEMAAMCEDLKTVTADRLGGLVKYGATVRQCTLKKNMLLFIPTGWLVVEIASSESPINYGCRKSWFDPVNVAKYAASIKVAKASGSPESSLDRMSKIHEILVAKTAK